MPFRNVHARHISILVMAVIMTFGLSLGHGFVGDDTVLFLNNNFYHSWSNFPRLFHSDYLTDSVNIISGVAGDLGSGSVAYRPVLSLTYFFDFWLWRFHAGGYHLHNLLLHLANVLLLYVLLLRIVEREQQAFWAGLIFAVHPLTVEAICAIGYRADLLATFFALLGLVCYVGRPSPRARDSKGAETMRFLAAHLFYFLGVFSKESVLILPGIFFLYDGLLRPKSSTPILMKGFGRYLGFVVIAGFYLWTYFVIFPNRAMSGSRLLNMDALTRMMTALLILCHYGVAMIFPFVVQTLPPLHIPPLGPLGGMTTGFTVMCFFILVFWAMKIARYSRQTLFFILWFILALAPVSNIIPLVNPMAYRFMYFPLVAAATLLAIFFLDILPSLAVSRANRAIPQIFRYGFVGASIILSALLARSWNNTYSIAAQMHHDFPNDPIACLLFAHEKNNIGKIDDANALLDWGFQHGLDDARAYYLRGKNESRDMEAAKRFFLEGIHRYPQVPACYLGLGRLLFLQGDYDQAVFYLNKHVSLVARSYKGYAYLIQAMILQGKPAEAEQVLHRAAREIPDRQAVKSLHDFLTIGDTPGLRIDLGC